MIQRRTVYIADRPAPVIIRQTEDKFVCSIDDRRNRHPASYLDGSGYGDTIEAAISDYKRTCFIRANSDE